MEKMKDFLAPTRASPSKSAGASSVTGNSQEEHSQEKPVEEMFPLTPATPEKSLDAMAVSD